LPVYVAGGGGTHLEPRVTSHYLAALIVEGGACGVLGTVTAVKTPQSETDAPLDDLVIGGQLPDGTATRLDLQITTTLSDEKWLDVVLRAWATFKRDEWIQHDQREFQRVLDALVRAEDPTATDDDILSFMKAMTIIAFDLDQENASRDRALCSTPMLKWWGTACG
jgi:hypothetical protein